MSNERIRIEYDGHGPRKVEIDGIEQNNVSNFEVTAYAGEVTVLKITQTFVSNDIQITKRA